MSKLKSFRRKQCTVFSLLGLFNLICCNFGGLQVLILKRRYTSFANMSEVENWIEIAKQCKYLPETDLKKLCDIVSEILLEESNVQPVSTPVTICGDIHGQVGLSYERKRLQKTKVIAIFSFMIWKSCSDVVARCQTQTTYF